MEIEDQRGECFDEVVAAPLSEHDMVMTLAVSVYRDLKRLTNS